MLPADVLLIPLFYNLFTGIKVLAILASLTLAVELDNALLSKAKGAYHSFLLSLSLMYLCLSQTVSLHSNIH
jgi:hypothetical protein